MTRTAVEWLKLGVALHREGRFAEALEAHEKAAAVDKWMKEADYTQVAAFDSLLRWDDPVKHRQCADIGVSKLNCGPPKPMPSVVGRRIRLAYISSDPKEHAVHRLLSGILKHHDLSRFELTEIQPDIAIDLMGHTRGNNLHRFAERIAPVQVAWLGYPGTTGLPTMDYLIADKFIATDEVKATVSEKLILMPDCYVCSSRDPIGSTTRAQHGLPADAFVFANFCQANRITEEAMRVWLRILRKVPGSVLWLMGSASAERTAEMRIPIDTLARKFGIDTKRIIYAKRLPHDWHMARLALADLYLDTFPYGSHTTASDVLWAGRPIITIAGKGFPSRVCGSILTTAGMLELIVRNWSDYADLAVRSARSPTLHDSVVGRAVRAKSSPLFDGERFCRNLEQAFEVMVAFRAP